MNLFASFPDPGESTLEDDFKNLARRDPRTIARAFDVVHGALVAFSRRATRMEGEELLVAFDSYRLATQDLVGCINRGVLSADAKIVRQAAKRNFGPKVFLECCEKYARALSRIQAGRVGSVEIGAETRPAVLQSLMLMLYNAGRWMLVGYMAILVALIRKDLNIPQLGYSEPFLGTVREVIPVLLQVLSGLTGVSEDRALSVLTGGSYGFDSDALLANGTLSMRLNPRMQKLAPARAAIAGARGCTLDPEGFAACWTSAIIRLVASVVPPLPGTRRKDNFRNARTKDIESFGFYVFLFAIIALVNAKALTTAASRLASFAYQKISRTLRGRANRLNFPSLMNILDDARSAGRRSRGNAR
jgi:hypothetical protein